MSLDEYRAANLAQWDERVAGHAAPDGYDLDSLINKPEYLTDVVRFDHDVLGDVAGRSLLHSQCHIATDTLSWAKLGAQVTGLDFSPKALVSARSTARQMGVEATFVECEFYEAPDHIDEQFDIVYTSVGAICWLPDIVKWAEILSAFVKPGGTFYFRDSHPMLLALDDERNDEQLVVAYDYFHSEVPNLFSNEVSYSGSAKLANPDGYEWAHSVSDVVNAITQAGLVIERFDELDHLDWRFLPWMEELDGKFYLPEPLRKRVPMQFSILATKPV